MAPKFHEPFSPAIMETTVPKKFVDLINKKADEILSDDEQIKKWDFSNNLVGKVRNEVQVPITKQKHREYLLNIMKQGCLDYLKYNMAKNRARIYTNQVGYTQINPNDGGVPTIENIHLTQSWVVSQYAGDFNPIHFHTGDFSAAIYLKVPDNMVDDLDDHAPAKGMIEFAFGNVDNFRSDSVKFQPEVGKFLVFPAWLKHLVYPFTCEGERRMMSFNAKIVFDK
tara:strand:+ start:1759 stop:2433 length:675 start_codon:yes stop_codon:yes gene_type:complete